LHPGLRTGWFVLAALIATQLMLAAWHGVLRAGAGPLSADRVMGQADFIKNAPNLVDAIGMNAPAGVAIDVANGHVLVADSQNNRVMGWFSAHSFAAGGAADLVIGQADFYSGQINRTGGSPSANSLATPRGVAFDSAGNLYVGDRSGTIFKIAQDRQIFVFATLEPSVAAYHLAFGIDSTLYVSGPTTSSCDNVYAIDRDGATTVFYHGLGRPQGLAVDIAGSVYVAASLGGRRGVVRISTAGEAQLVIAGSSIVGFTFIPGGNALVATLNPHPSPASAVYHVALGIEGWRAF